MRDNFNKQLEDLYSSVKYMGSLCEKAIENASQTVVGDNADKIKEYAKNVNFYEKEINHSEDYIEKLCMGLLLHQQPVASDLRTVSSALKLISDMERIGDQASDITELSGYINNCEFNGKIHLKDMFKATIDLVKKAVTSFSEKNLEMAQSAILDDDIIDNYFDKVKIELIQMIQSNTDAELCVDLLMVAKYLERIGDHSVNIAEWVKWIIGLFASTLPVAVVTIFVTEVIEKRLQIGEGTFKKMQIFGASVSSFAHGAQDGQKFAGVLALSASISLEGVENTNIVVPVWCSVLSAVFISCGVLLGGRKIVQSFDEFAPHKPSAGFSADLCSAVMLLALSVLGVSAATTIAKSSAVMGAGRALGVMPKTNVIKKMAFAWVLTVPLCFVLSFLITEVLEFVFAVC